MRKIPMIEQVYYGCRTCTDYSGGCPFYACPYVPKPKHKHSKTEPTEEKREPFCVDRKQFFPRKSLKDRYDTKKIIALYMGGMMLTEIAERMALKPQEVDVVVKEFLKGGRNGIL